MDSLRSLLGSPELLFAVTLTAKTCAAACVHGANAVTVFRRVTLPLVRW